MKNKPAVTLSVLIFIVLLGILSTGLGVQCSSGIGGDRVTDIACYEFIEQVVQPLLLSFITFFVVSLVLVFLRREVFFTWAKFAVPAFIIMVGIMLYTYNNTPDVGGWVDWGSDDQFATLTLPPLFFIISVIIIARKARRLRHFDSKKSVPTF